MPAITFDTLAYSKRLQQAGVPAGQADAFAEAQKAAMDEIVAAKDLATKGDVLEVKMELHKAMHELKVSLIKWVSGLFFAQSALLYTFISAMK